MSPFLAVGGIVKEIRENIVLPLWFGLCVAGVLNQEGLLDGGEAGDDEARGQQVDVAVVEEPRLRPVAVRHPLLSCTRQQHRSAPPRRPFPHLFEQAGNGQSRRYI